MGNSHHKTYGEKILSTQTSYVNNPHHPYFKFLLAYLRNTIWLVFFLWMFLGASVISTLFASLFHAFGCIEDYAIHKVIIYNFGNIFDQNHAYPDFNDSDGCLCLVAGSSLTNVFYISFILAVLIGRILHPTDTFHWTKKILLSQRNGMKTLECRL